MNLFKNILNFFKKLYTPKQCDCKKQNNQLINPETGEYNKDLIDFSVINDWFIRLGDSNEISNYQSIRQSIMSASIKIEKDYYL